MANTIAILAGLATLIWFLYTIGKDIWLYFKNKKIKKTDRSAGEKNEGQYKQVERRVNFNYPKDSGLQDGWLKEGFDVVWVSPRNVESKKLEGYEVMYGTDEQRKEKFSLSCLNSGGEVDHIFMGKKELMPTEEKK